MKTSQNITADGDYILNTPSGSDILVLSGDFDGATVALYVSPTGQAVDKVSLSDGAEDPVTITAAVVKTLYLWPAAPLVLNVTGAGAGTNIDAIIRG